MPGTLTIIRVTPLLVNELNVRPHCTETVEAGFLHPQPHVRHGSGAVGGVAQAQVGRCRGQGQDRQEDQEIIAYHHPQITTIYFHPPLFPGAGMLHAC